MSAAPYPHSLSDIAEEFRLLDIKRRKAALSDGEREQYHSLFERLSDALAGGVRYRRMNERKFLRVPFPMTVQIRRGSTTLSAPCLNFGGGGCAILAEQFLLEEEAFIDSIEMAGETYRIDSQSQICWSRHTESGGREYGLRFLLESPEVRDTVDRIFYQALGHFINGQPEPVVESKPAMASSHS